GVRATAGGPGGERGQGRALVQHGGGRRGTGGGAAGGAGSMSEHQVAPSPLARLLADGPRAVSVGVEQFAADLRPWDADVVTVDWRPPSGGAAVRQALWRLSEPGVAARVEAANARVVTALLGARPFLVD